METMRKQNEYRATTDEVEQRREDDNSKLKKLEEYQGSLYPNSRYWLVNDDDDLSIFEIDLIFRIRTMFHKY